MSSWWGEGEKKTWQVPKSKFWQLFLKKMIWLLTNDSESSKHCQWEKTRKNVPWTFILPVVFLGFGAAPSLASSEDRFASSSSSDCNKICCRLWQDMGKEIDCFTMLEILSYLCGLARKLLLVKLHYIVSFKLYIHCSLCWSLVGGRVSFALLKE